MKIDQKNVSKRQVNGQLRGRSRPMQLLLPPLLLIMTLVAMTFLAYVWPVWRPFPTPMRIVAGVLAAIGILIAAKGARTFRMVGTNIMTFDKPNKLVTTGLFALSRNPMYLGFAICALAGGVALGAVSSLVIATVFCITLDGWYVRFEECVMRDTFGVEFEAYCLRVRRWI
ncbi:MAG: methyltransferase family protein [Paracoccaceae bacterium]